MNLRMLSCEQLCMLLLLLGAIKFTIALNNLNDKINMVRYECRSEVEELKNRFSEMRPQLDKERYGNDALERRLKETLNTVNGICSGSQNVQTLVKQIDTEQKRTNKQAEQIDQLKERIEGLEYQLTEEKAKRSSLEATIESKRMKCDVTETNEAETNEAETNEAETNEAETNEADCDLGDQTCAMFSEDGSGSTERCEGNQGKKQVLLGRTVESQSRVNVASDNNTYIPFITGSTVMNNGYIVLCDHLNYKLQLLDSSLNITASLSFSSWPWDVSAIDNTNVIVTLPDKQQLQFIQVIPHMKAGRILHLGKSCYGIAVGKDQMYISCHNDPGEGEVRILSMNGTLLHQLGVNQNGSFMFMIPHYIAVSKSCDKVFVSDWDTNTITCMSDAGQILYQYKDDDLRGPVGMYYDGGDNIVVCDRFSHNVQVITAEGKKHGVLASSADGIRHPYSISYRHSDNTLIIGLGNSHYILTFKLSE